MAMLAQMFGAASHPIAYTGAGISTAAGIRDYATKGRAVGGARSPLDAEPSEAHRVLVQLHKAGKLTTWVQQVSPPRREPRSFHLSIFPPAFD